MYTYEYREEHGENIFVVFASCGRSVGFVACLCLYCDACFDGIASCWERCVVLDPHHGTNHQDSDSTIVDTLPGWVEQQLIYFPGT